MTSSATSEVLVEPGTFGPFEGVWLNAAHQGPLPEPAVAAARGALAAKVDPGRLDDRAFEEVPSNLKESLARLVGASPGQIVLGNSTSYGLNLVAQGLALGDGDEVLLVEGDFPATVIPWLPLERRGVRVRRLVPRTRPLTAEQLESELSPSTRLFCSSWVFSFTGEAIDLEAVGAVCRERDVLFVVNGSQAIGARPLDVASQPIDALTCCGFKWLCGPYATGFCWLAPELLECLDYQPAYWIAHMREDGEVRMEAEPRLREGLGAAEYDVFGTANFLNFAPWRASVELLLEIGVQRIADHDQRLVARLLDGLVGSDWEVVSPSNEAERSTLVVVRNADGDHTAAAFRTLAAAGIGVASRAGSIRLSPHLYNTESEIDRALDVLTSA